MRQYDIVDAVDRGDFAAARQAIDAWLKEPEIRGVAPFHLTFISKYVMHSGDAEMRDFVISYASAYEIRPGDIIDYREGVALIFFHIGVSFLPNLGKATEWLTKSLEAIPDFLPALVELAIIERQIDRNAVFRSLGDHLPNLAWRYNLAAAQLQFPTRFQLSPVSDARPAGIAGLAIRGRCDNRTPALLRYYRYAIGNQPICVATWDTTDQNLIDEMAEHCDEIVVVPEVKEPGVQNRARQIVLGRSALMACRQKCDLALLIRTDMAMFRRNLLGDLSRLWQAYPGSDSQLVGRIIIPSVYTRKYYSDHPADLFMFGATEDLLKYWGCPLDTPGDQHLFNEQYLSKNFRALLGIGSESLSLSDYHNYLRDYFIVRDYPWFDAHWLGREALTKEFNHQVGYHRLVSQAEWENLSYCDRQVLERLSWAAGMRGPLLETVFGRSV